MKKLYILILMSTLIACTDKNQNKSDIEQNSTHAKVQEPKITNQSGSKDDILVQEKVSNNEPRIFRSNQNITE